MLGIVPPNRALLWSSLRTTRESAVTARPLSHRICSAVSCPTALGIVPTSMLVSSWLRNSSATGACLARSHRFFRAVSRPTALEIVPVRARFEMNLRRGRQHTKESEPTPHSCVTLVPLHTKKLPAHASLTAKRGQSIALQPGRQPSQKK